MHMTHDSQRARRTGVPRHKNATRRHHAKGFTLVELMVVVVILAILAGLVVGASLVLVKGQKKRVTESLIQTLDRALEEYYAVQKRPTPPIYDPELYDEVPGTANQLRTYGQPPNDSHSARPDTSVFIRQASGFGEVDAILQGIPAQFLVLTPNQLGSAADESDVKNLYPSVIDAWGELPWPGHTFDGGPVQRWPAKTQQLVYYVHPNNELAQALYGRCINGRPYFVSAGPDKFYGLPTEVDAIAAYYGSGASEFAGDLEKFEKEMMRRGRRDNIYSSPVNVEFDIPDDAAQALGND